MLSNNKERREQDNYFNGNEVVISGMSGTFPKSNSVLEFMENLYNKVNMVLAVTPYFPHPDASSYLGQVNNLDKFDAQFFKVTFNQAMSLDPMCRKLMEHAYSAVFDAGINPLSLSGTKTGVYVGTCYMDSVLQSMYKSCKSNTFLISGCAKTMLANRISYFLNATGPSYCVEASTASSLLALDLAYKDMSTGMIDAAFVAGCNICKHPLLSINLKRTGLLCGDGKTKCFDKDGDGCVRSEAISVMFLQKAKDAKRVYCEVYGTKTSCSKPDIHCPKVRREDDITRFLDEFYSQVDVDPSDVEYVEASASGVAAIDEQELKAINNFFAKDSKVNFGSVKSNMGDSEGASGMCSLTKVCLAYHKGQIPATINSLNPLEWTGNAVLVKENTPFGRGFAAINDLSYTGTDCHALLKGHYKPKDIECYKINIPYLICISGRKEDYVNELFGILKSYSLDPEYIGMLHNIHSHEIRGHTARGFILLDNDENKKSIELSRSVGHYTGTKRPVWFVFSGMGSQWLGMGADLMRIKTFSESVKKCDTVLAPKGIDIIKIITSKEDAIFSNIMGCFVGIAAVQIGLMDILKAVGIECDYMIGHSVGETACGYADGCLTAEEMILSAYSRGRASLETNFIQGAMAAVGLGYKELSPICPPDIDIACHNSDISSTISGPAGSVSQFIKQLKEKEIFSKKVPSSNIAYHSRYIAGAATKLMKHLNEVIKEPKLRSDKWLSTSVKEEEWQEPYAQYCSPEYFTNNLLNYVYFEETSNHIPSDAIVIEIAPHGLLQAILKRSHPECLHIPLTRRGTHNQVKFLLEAIGKIYEAGVSVKIEALYPKIEYPVSTETPFLSHLVKWEHSVDWPSLDYTREVILTRNRNVVISIFDEYYVSILGNIKNDNIVFPESALLVLTWETLAMSLDMDYRNLSVKFTNLKFNSQLNVNPQKLLNLSICITRVQGRFEVTYENKIVVSGVIKEIDGEKLGAFDHCSSIIKNYITLYESDIYKYLNLRGYRYENEFRSLYSLTADCTEARVKWTGDWITFLGGLIQINILANNHNGISKVHLIESLTIDVNEHSMEQHQLSVNNSTLYKADYYKMLGIVRSGGVQLVDILFDDVVPVEILPDYVGTKQFWPHVSKKEVNIYIAMFINMQIIVDAGNKNEINITELRSSKELHAISEVIEEVSTKIPIHIRFASISMINDKFLDLDCDIDKTEVLLAYDIITDTKKTSELFSKRLLKNGFIMTLEKKENKKHIKDKDFFNVITSISINCDYILALLKRKENIKSYDCVIVKIGDNNIFLTKTIQNDLQYSNNRIVLVAKLRYFCDFTGYLKSLQERYGTRISLFLILDSNAPDFDVENIVYRAQLLKKLPFNTLFDGEWGGYYYTSSADHNILRNEKFYLKEKYLNILERKETMQIMTKNTVQVKYTGLALRDTGKLIESKRDLAYGMDFSGFDRRGNRVMGLISGGANLGEIEYDADLLWPVPDHWTLEEAATVPLPFVHAYYCLGIRSNFRRNQTIFITDGASALGQALIAICLSLNCDIYTAVSDIEKIHLLKLFPELDEKKIITSGSQDFFSNIVAYTENKLCNIVINTETGTSRVSAMKCVGIVGEFLDLSNHDAIENNEFGYSYLNYKTYRAFNVFNIFRTENSMNKKKVQFMIAEGIAKGIVRPLSFVTFSDSEVPIASKLLVSRKYTGKIVIKLSHESIRCLKHRLTVNSSHTYMIIGEQDELSIGLINFLVERGAKTICLNIEPKPISPFLNAQLNTWKNQDVAVKITHHITQESEQCNIYINEALELGPIEGIFILLNNNEIENDSKKSFDTNTVILKNLDELSRDFETIRYFVVIAKNITTAEDEFSFTAYSKICQFRNYIGLPALLYRPEFVQEMKKCTLGRSQKFRRQTIQQVLNVLDTCIEKDYNNAISFNTIKSSKCDYLERLAEIIGIKHDKSELDDITTLNDYDNVKLRKISSLIHECYFINVPLEELKQMSLLSIYNIDQELFKFNTNSLDTFISFVKYDPCEGTDPVKVMITKLNDNLTTFDHMEYIDPKADYLFLIPGFEGHYGLFEAFCLGVNYKALTLQLGPDLIGDSIPEMAENILKNLLLEIDIRDRRTFYLLGYSFGVNVALELAALLEKKGLVGVVLCLDSSPDILRNRLDATIGDFVDTELQNALVDHIYYLMTKETNAELKEQLTKCETFEEKINSFIKCVKKHVSYPHEFMRLILESSYKKILLAQKYNPTYNLDSELILIKGTLQSNVDIMADYNLSKFSNKPIKVINIDSSHATIPFDGKLPSVINNILNLNSGKKINPCENTFLK